MAGGQHPVRARTATLPNRPRGVGGPAAWEPIAPGEPGLAGGAAAVQNGHHAEGLCQPVWPRFRARSPGFSSGALHQALLWTATQKVLTGYRRAVRRRAEQLVPKPDGLPASGLPLHHCFQDRVRLVLACLAALQFRLLELRFLPKGL